MKRMVFALAFLNLGAVAVGGDWVQFQFDPANRGRAPTAVEPPYQLRWVWYGPDDEVACGRPCAEGQAPRPRSQSTAKLSFTMHPVVAEGRVVFGDLTGSLFCLDSRNGTTIWQRKFPGAWVGPPAICRPEKPGVRPVVVTACQDGVLYGVDWDGEIIWRRPADRPFVTAVKLDGARAYAGSLDGRMFAVEATKGELLWTCNVGAPIRQPVAVAGGRLFFGSEDMVFHALDAATGRVLWQTPKGLITGQSFRNTWPVVVGDKVMTFQVLVDGQSEFIMESLLFGATPGGDRQKRLEDWPLERRAILDWLGGEMHWAVDCNKSWQEGPGKIRPGTRSLA